MTFFGWLSDPFKGSSDLQLGDEKVTLNHLVSVVFLDVFSCTKNKLPREVLGIAMRRFSP